MAGVLDLPDDRIIDERALVRELAITEASLAAARKRGELRCRQVGHRRFYTGRQLRAWLEGAEPAEAGEALPC